MMRARLSIVMLTCSAALVALPSAVEAQAARGTPLDSATAAAIAPILARARAANVPVDLLVARARAGQVQRVPVAQIAAAVRDLADRIQAASDALSPNPSEPELRAGADALKIGVPVQTLREMRKRSSASLAVPIGVLTELVARGVPVEQASVKIVDLLQRSATSKTFIALSDRVREDVLAGLRPEESLDLRLKGIMPTLPITATAEGAGIQTLGAPKRPR